MVNNEIGGKLVVRASEPNGGSWLKALTALPLAAAACASGGPPASASTCSALAGAANTGTDVSDLLADCLKSLPAGSRLTLPPGTYRLQSPIRIEKPVTIATRGLADEAPGCGELGRGRCATLVLAVEARAAKPRTMPVEIAAPGTSLIHLVVRGAGRDSRLRSSCRSPSTRALGGGIRVSASRFTIRKSVLRDMTCYSALEITKGADRVTVAENRIGPNGDHGTDEMWSDGVTVHDSAYTSVVGNRFVDNTDVQLIFGGCRECRVEGNRFDHSGPFVSASFAELMLQAWPGTSGEYRDTVVSGNRIDCGRAKLCGYGIMLGSAPWYPGPTSGGTVAGNSVANAMIAINVDSLSGPMEVRDNRVRSSGGRFASDCGFRLWPAVNVEPGSRRFVHGGVSNAPQGSLSTSHCLLNRRPNP